MSDRVRAVPDWPKPGILFRDLTPLWADGDAWARATAALARPYDAKPPELVLGIEARGFVAAAALAARWGAGVLLARKPGKLPGTVHRQEYALEYGTAAMEAHREIVPAGKSVLVADDVLATGGTAAAAHALAVELGLVPVGFAFVLEIAFLGGRTKLPAGLPCHSVLSYDAAGTVTERA